MVKCIYCGVEENLSKSDIIPVALTNSKLTKKNVCATLHNNNFGNTFEAEVINKLSYLRDSLDITTSKNKYPETEININIDGTVFRKIGNKNTRLLGNDIITSKEGKSKIGPIDMMKNMVEREVKKGNEVAEFKEMDLNARLIETQVPLNVDTFISLSAKRLIAKIAYEWYCYHYNIEDFKTEFSGIVNYICDEEAARRNDLVTYINNVNIYSIINENTFNGSHTLMAYEKIDGSVNVLVSFFGICIYNVKVLTSKTNNYKTNCFLQEFQVTTKKVTLPRQAIDELERFILENTVISNEIRELEIRQPKSLENGKEWEGVLLYITLLQELENTSFVLEYDKNLIKLLLFYYQKVISETVLHIRSLKRFVKESIFGVENIQLNIKGNDSQRIFLYYMVFLIGKINIEKLDINSLNGIIKESFSVDSKLVVNQGLTKKILKEIISVDNYVEILYSGAKKIEQADFDYADR